MFAFLFLLLVPSLTQEHYTQPEERRLFMDPVDGLAAVFYSKQFKAAKLGTWKGTKATADDSEASSENLFELDEDVLVGHEGVYIRHAHTKRRLACNYDKSATKLDLESANERISDAQLWDFKGPDSDGYYEIVNVGNPNFYIGTRMGGASLEHYKDKYAGCFDRRRAGIRKRGEDSFDDEYTLMSYWRMGLASNCEYLDCKSGKDRRACADMCSRNSKCNVFNHCPRGADCKETDRCCTRHCNKFRSGELSLKFTKRWEGWNVYTKTEDNAPWKWRLEDIFTATASWTRIARLENNLDVQGTYTFTKTTGYSSSIEDSQARTSSVSNSLSFSAEGALKGIGLSGSYERTVMNDFSSAVLEATNNEYATSETLEWPVPAQTCLLVLQLQINQDDTMENIRGMIFYSTHIKLDTCPTNDGEPTVQTTTQSPTQVVSGSGSCFIAACGCPGAFQQSWCSESDAIMIGWCGASASNCASCTGSWCSATPSTITGNTNV